MAVCIPCGFYGYRNFCIEGEDGEIFAEANSVWVFMDTEKMRPARVSERMQEVYIPEIRDEIPGEWADRKISLPDEAVQKSVEKEPVRVSRFYIDTNHHMNNGKYILVAEEYLPEQVFVCGLRAEYRKAAMLGDMLYPVVTMEEKQITVTLADEKGAVICHYLLSDSEKRKAIIKMQLGEYQKLVVIKKVEFGVYLAERMEDGNPRVTAGETGAGRNEDRG